MTIFSRILLIMAIAGWLFCLFIHLSAFIDPDLAFQLSFENIYMFSALIIIALTGVTGLKKFMSGAEYSLMGKGKMILQSFSPWWIIPLWILHLGYLGLLATIVDKNNYLEHMGFSIFTENSILKGILPDFMFKEFLNDELKISTIFTMLLYLFPIFALYPVKQTQKELIN